MIRLLTLVITIQLAAFAYAQTPPSDDKENNAAANGSPSAGSAPELMINGVPLSVYKAKAANGVTAPRPIKSPDPEYSIEARQQKVQGSCVLWLVVGTDGLPRSIRVQKGLGFGLDEKAVEAVRQWRFEPALKDGKPVPVQINIEVSFRLYNDNKRIHALEILAADGDAKAELELSDAYFQGRDVTRSEKAGYGFLWRSANRGLPEAQFRMGEYAASHATDSRNYIDAYLWYSLAQRNHYKHCDKKLKELTTKMSALEVAEAQKRAQDWQPPKVVDFP